MNLVGQQLGEFEILERLGQGGMGAVYKARQTSLDRLVALKTLQAGIADDADYIARFKQEAKAAAALNHPNLVQVYFAGETDGLHWFAMEYVEGESAKAKLQRKGRIDPLQAIAIAIHVATALEYGWRKAHLIHRDIKPDNIFLSKEASVKVGDLGLAKVAGQTQALTVTGHSMGSPYYISPEQVQDMREVDLRADIYSLGCTLFHMISGKPPFEGSNGSTIMLKHITDPTPILQDAYPECAPALSDVVEKMMQKDPADRQQDYETVMNELRDAYEVMSNPDAGAKVVESPKPEGVTKGMETPPTPRAAAPKSPAVIAGESPLPSKPKWPRHVSLVVGVLALIGASLFLFKSKVASPSPAHPSAGGHAPAPPSAVLESGAVRLWDSPEEIHPRPGVEWRDGAVYLDNNALLVDSSELSRDAIVRAEIKMNADARATQICLRIAGSSSEGTEMLYGLDIDVAQKVLRLHSCVNGHFKEMRHWPLPRPYGNDEWMSLEFRAIGDDVTISADGSVLGSVHDSTQPQAGGVRIHAAAKSYFRHIVYVPLDRRIPVTLPTATSSAAPSFATKDLPFVNSLGMKFVPVPITGGPTNGQQVLFSVWETRVQDYEVFVEETKRDWPKPPFAQNHEHPAVNVTWEDAKAFCEWLTQRERKAGNIGETQVYRLPSDHEWSCAAGIGEREEATKLPSEKDGQIPDVFPWGTAWPPPPNAGNFAGDELRAAPEPGRMTPYKRTIPGYRDDFVETSPVGNFSANRFGLFDMGGNAWQWCLDWMDQGQKGRVQRGGSWDNYDRRILLSSSRHSDAPDHRGNDTYGFRCVLALPDK